MNSQIAKLPLAVSRARNEMKLILCSIYFSHYIFALDTNVTFRFHKWTPEWNTVLCLHFNLMHWTSVPYDVSNIIPFRCQLFTHACACVRVYGCRTCYQLSFFGSDTNTISAENAIEGVSDCGGCRIAIHCKDDISETKAFISLFSFFCSNCTTRHSRSRRLSWILCRQRGFRSLFGCGTDQSSLDTANI